MTRCTSQFVSGRECLQWRVRAVWTANVCFIHYAAAPPCSRKHHRSFTLFNQAAPPRPCWTPSEQSSATDGDGQTEMNDTTLDGGAKLLLFFVVKVEQQVNDWILLKDKQPIKYIVFWSFLVIRHPHISRKVGFFCYFENISQSTN